MLEMIVEDAVFHTQPPPECKGYGRLLSHRARGVESGNRIEVMGTNVNSFLGWTGKPMYPTTSEAKIVLSSRFKLKILTAYRK